MITFYRTITSPATSVGGGTSKTKPQKTPSQTRAVDSQTLDRGIANGSQHLRSTAHEYHNEDQRVARLLFWLTVVLCSSSTSYDAFLQQTGTSVSPELKQQNRKNRVCVLFVCVPHTYTHTPVYVCGGFKKRGFRSSLICNAFFGVPDQSRSPFSHRGTRGSGEDGNEDGSPRVTTQNPLVRHHPQAAITAAVTGLMASRQYSCLSRSLSTWVPMDNLPWPPSTLPCQQQASSERVRVT